MLSGAMLLNRGINFYLFVAISALVVIVNAMRVKNKYKNSINSATTDHFSIYTLAEKKVVEETPLTNTPTGEKDETPKTGTIDIISYVLIATFISAVAIIVLKKKI